MGATGRRTNARLIDRLLSQPQRFDFFQATYLLERHGWSHALEQTPLSPVGEDALPSAEAVRFSVETSLGFPISSILRIREPKALGDSARRPPTEMEVGFFGLLGPSGVLPDHYAAMTISRLASKDAAFKDLLDLFHHRLLSLFYRTKAKYHLPLAYARWRQAPGRGERAAADPFTDSLYSLIGMGTRGLQGRMANPDEALLRYAPLLASQTRTAQGLQNLLSDYFGIPVRVCQFQSGWLYLHPRDSARLPGPRDGGRRLGRDFVVGRRVYDRQAKFRLRIGPLDIDRFRELLPIGKYRRSLDDLTTLHVGSELDYDVQLVLNADDAPEFRLGADQGPRLGWDSWLLSDKPKADLEDAVFTLDGDALVE